MRPSEIALVAYQSKSVFCDVLFRTGVEILPSDARPSKRWSNAGFGLRYEATRSPLDAALNRRPERLGKGAVLRIDGDRDALLPLGEDHRHILPTPSLIKPYRPREGKCSRTGGQVHFADCISHFQLVGGTRGFQRLLQDPRMAV